MKMYDENMIYFEIRGDMGVGYSGAPVVNCGGFVVGMVTGGMTEVHHVMGTGPFVRYAGPHMDEIISENPEAVRNQMLDEYTCQIFMYVYLYLTMVLLGTCIKM